MSRAEAISDKPVHPHKLYPAVKRWLYDYRPRFRDHRFWLVQAHVIGIAMLHNMLEYFELRGWISELGALYLVPVTLFVVPLIYAALNFGFTGSIATIFWIILLNIPNIIIWHTGLDRYGEIFQIGVLVSIAIFTGQRVDREARARYQAEAASKALRSSETKYRGLFESSPIAILVFDSGGAILDANPAAGALFGQELESLRYGNVSDLLGNEGLDKLLGSSDSVDSSLVLRNSSIEVYLEPACTQVRDDAGNIITQAVLRDITQERQRQDGLKAYAGYVLRVQEEERQRVAHELHDETIQSLVLICRCLGALEARNPPFPPPVTSELEGIRKMAEQVVKGLRDFTRSLRPPILDDLGLVASIRRLLVDFTEQTGIKGHLRLADEQRRLSPELELAIFRISQETLRNVEKHSKASEVTTSLSFGKDEVRLNITDNGKGFVMPQGLATFTANRQLGLLGMRERAGLLGGKLQIQSAPGQGTTISVTFPVSHPG